MDVRCSVCGEENPARARFCLACGTPLVGPVEPARESRRTLSVLFADVVGFTALGERLDSESLRRVMDRFYAEMRGAVEVQGGTVAKFIGDAVMAVWGTPEVREDDAMRAVRAADDMRAALRALNEDLDRRWGVRLGLRTGVNTGEVVVDPGKGADLLVGDTLNVAARLEQAAADGDVLLGPDTARLVRHEADLEPVAPLELKGIARPLPAWRLRSARAGERPRAARLQAPLVGRERETAHLRSAFYGAAAARETRLISVIGSPGVGKTRLVAEFAAGIRHEARVLTARCEPTTQGSSLLPVARAIRAAAGVGDDDGPEKTRTRLAATLPGDAERDLIAERAAGIAGSGPDIGVEETFWAVRRLLEGLAEADAQPVVLVVDDVQWAQATLLDLLVHLARWGREAPVLVVVLARPEIRELCPALATPGDVAVDVVEVGPLGARESRTLVDRLLGSAADLPQQLADRVLETTEGNPLFLSETLRMLVDEGVLERQDGRWAVQSGEAASEVAVPPTIQALLAARIERLSPGERLVIERAAVIGQRFSALALRELVGPGARNGLDECLEGLHRKELVAREQARPGEGAVFHFHHALIRDAAYRSLLKEARAELHERHAMWLEARPGEHDEAIGFHLERAHAYRHQLGPLDDRGRSLGRRGAERLHAAARRALAREDLRAAADLLDRGLAALDGDEPERRTPLLPDLAEALLSAGKTTAAEPVVEELILRAGGDRALKARATVFACQLSNLAGGGHVRETIGRVRRAAGVLAGSGDRAGEAKAHHVAAVAYASLGQIAAAEAALDRALVAAREAGDARRVTAVLGGAPQAAVRGPSPIVRASGRCLDVVRILRMTPGNRSEEAAALRCQAVLEAMRGRFTAARGIIDGCRATLEELGLTYELHELGVHSGMVELLAGDPDAAGVELWAAKQGFASLGVESGAALAAALLARALLDQERVEEAEAETRFAELRGDEDLKTAIAWRGVRAEALARRGEFDAALELARRANELGEPTDALADKADAAMALAAVLREAGRDTEARTAAIAARDLYAAKDHAVGLQRAETAAGLAPSPRAVTPALTMLAARGREPRGEELLAQWARLATAADYDGLRAMYGPEDDYVLEDRRHLAGNGVQRGVEAGIETVRSVNRMTREVDWSMLPGPGRAAGNVLVASGLCRVSGFFAETDGRFEADYGIVSLARDGLVRHAVVTDADAPVLLATYDEMCERAFGRAGSGITAVERTAAETIACLNERRWDDLRGLYADEIVVTDLRAIGSPPARGLDAVVAMLRDIPQFLPDVRWSDRVIAVEAGVAAVTHTELSGHSADGGAVALALWRVLLVDPDGRLRRAELFDSESDALARLRVVGAWCRGLADAGEQLSRRDWSAVDGRYSTHLRFVDQRAGLRDTSEGIEAFWNTVFEQTTRLHVAVTLLDARTGRLGAVRMHVAGTTVHGGRFEQVADQIVTVDHAGVVTSIEMHDPGDPALEARLDELEREALAAER